MSKPTPPASQPWAVDRAAQVCSMLNIDLGEFFGSSRHPSVVKAREVAAYLIHHFPGPGGQRASLSETAVSMARGNHTTIITAIRRLERNRDQLELAERIAARLHIDQRPIPVLQAKFPVQVPSHVFDAICQFLDDLAGDKVAHRGKRVIAGRAQAALDMLRKAKVQPPATGRTDAA